MASDKPMSDDAPAVDVDALWESLPEDQWGFSVIVEAEHTLLSVENAVERHNAALRRLKALEAALDQVPEVNVANLLVYYDDNEGGNPIHSDTSLALRHLSGRVLALQGKLSVTRGVLQAAEQDNKRLQKQLHAMGQLKDGYGEDGVARCLDEQNNEIERLRGLLVAVQQTCEELLGNIEKPSDLTLRRR